VDKEVVDDNDLITSRKSEDIPAFNKAMIDLFNRTRKLVRPVE
jgi:protease I